MHPIIFLKSAVTLVGLGLGIGIGFLVYQAIKSQNSGQHYSENRNSGTYRNFECNQICTVCLDECEGTHNTICLPCGHKYHRNCILNVFREEARNRRICPNCRARVSEDFISRELKTVIS